MTSPKPHSLREEILAHPGKKYLDTLRTYSISKNILAGNGVQLRTLIALLEDPARAPEFMSLDKREHLRNLQNEVDRHFHNFLASAKTLVDHTRVIMNEPFISETHRVEYRKKVAQLFSGESLIGFMHELRNFALHRSIPFVTMRVSIHAASGSLDSAILVDLDKMADWEGWRSEGKAFIGLHRPSIRIRELIDGYECKIREFYEWFCLQFQKHYEKEMEEVLALQKQWIDHL